MKTDLTIYDIKERTRETAPYFFAKDTLRFFGQKMSDFKVKRLDNTHYMISAPAFVGMSGQRCGETKRIFNTETNELECVEKEA